MNEEKLIRDNYIGTSLLFPTQWQQVQSTNQDLLG